MKLNPVIIVFGSILFLVFSSGSSFAQKVEQCPWYRSWSVEFENAYADDWNGRGYLIMCKYKCSSTMQFSNPDPKTCQPVRNQITCAEQKDSTWSGSVSVSGTIFGQPAYYEYGKTTVEFLRGTLYCGDDEKARALDLCRDQSHILHAVSESTRHTMMCE